MSSLGGSRGERNAKPKFSALDINSLYRTSRGESLEPSQQKNTVPRKHGMQSLGKVPSARRPPANLPSLKAETSTPTESSTTANDSSTSITSASSTPPQQKQNNSSNNFSSHNNSNNNNNQQQGGGNHQQQSTNSGNSSSSDRNSNNSTSWSAVTTSGTQPQEGIQPPLYQSPQFQHEFPSLDGTTPSGSKSHQAQTNASNAGMGNNAQNNQQTQQQQQTSGNQNASQYDGPQMSLRPQTEPSTWMQQNMSGKGDVGNNSNSPNSQQVPVLQVPPQLKALMPSFMYRSGGGGSNTGSSGFGLPLSNNSSSQNQQSQQHQSGNNNQQQNNYQNRMRNNFGNSGNNNEHPSYQGRRSGNIPPRLQNQQQRQNQYDDNYSNRGPPLIEAEAIVHRPIIRDEELERIENIAKDDGWAKDDTIDYNQKLNFSDEELDPPPSASVIKDQRKHEKDDINKKMSDEEKRISWGRDKERHDYDRHDSRYEKESRHPQNGVERRTLDMEILERVKQRREEEEKREMERKQAAAKKLQALEQKLQSKRAANASEDSDNASSSITAGIQKIEISKEPRHSNQYGGKEPYDRRERYDKYDRERGDRERNDRSDPRDRNYLPPRFQRQQHSGNERSGAPGFERNERPSYRNTERTSSSNNLSGGPTSTTNKENSSSPASSTTDNSKNVPFAQQYDPRYIHQNMSKQLLQQKRRSDEMMQPRRSNENRGRLDSDRDDHFQRKTSVSSSDDKPVSIGHAEKSSSRERITSWVDELEDERHDSKNDSFTDKQKQLLKSIDQTPSNEYEPKQILQRSKTSVSDDSSSNLNKSLGHDDKKGDEKTSNTEKRSSESPKSWADHSAGNETTEKTLNDDTNKKDEVSDEKKKLDSGKLGLDHGKSSYKDIDDRRHDKRNVRGGARDTGNRRYDSRDSREMRGGHRDSRGGYGSYRGSSSNWNRRGGRGGYRYGNQDYYSESEGSDYDDDYDRKDSRKGGKDLGKSGRDAFAPRGEPSRRGRGSSNMQYNRRGQMHGPPSGGSNKRIDNYGPPSRKSPFTGSDDQKDDYNERERKVSEHSTSDDKSKTKQPLKPTSQKGSEAHNKTSIKNNDEKHTEENKRSHDSNVEKYKNDDKKEKSDMEQDHGHRKIFGGGKREDGDRSYSRQYRDSGGSSQQQSNQRSSSGKPQSQQQSQKDEHSKPLSKPPGLSGKPRMKTTSTSSVGSNSERENSRSQPQPQRSNSNKDIQLQRGNKPQTASSGTTLNKSGGSSSSHWDPKKETNSSEKSHDEVVQQQQNREGAQQPATTTDNANKTDTTNQGLDGTTAPVNTLIFENTNYKTNPAVSTVATQQQNAASNASSSMKRVMPGVGNQQQSGNNQKLHQSQEDVFKSSTPTTTTINDLMMDQQRAAQQQVVAAMQQSQEQALNSALQSIDFNKADVEYDKDMKFNFTFGPDLSSQITTVTNDDKNQVNKQGNNMGKSMHGVSSNVVQNNIISGSAVDLNMKIASAKKIWDVMPTVMEHANNDAAVESAAAQIASNVASYQHQQHQLHQFAQAHANMSHVQHALSSSNNYSNFGHDQSTLEQHFSGNKPSSTDQGIGNDDNSYISSSTSQHSSAVGQNQQGHNQNIKHVSEVLGNNANICKVKPSQQQLQQASGLGLSPPPQMQSTIPAAPQSYYQASQAYGMSAIPSPPAAVVFNQASQAGMYNPFQIEAGRSQFSQYATHYGATGNAPYANYMQTPPTMPTAPAHAEMYQNAFRTMGGAVQTPFNQSQQMNNPSTVLISSTSNTLMSTSVKPPSQIGAIGSKSGQPYGAQQYMGVYPQQAPLQNNSFYSNTGQQQTNPAFFGTAAAGTIQNYAGMFGNHGTPTPTNPPQAQFGSQYPQQYRGPNTGNTNQQGSGYMKQGGQGQNNAGQTQQGQQGMPDSQSLQSSKGSSNNGTPDGHSSSQQQVQPAQSSPSQHMKNFTATNWDMQNQIFQQQLINATLFQQQQQQYQPQNVPPCYPSPIQRPNNNYDRMNMQMSGQQYYSNNRGQTSQSTTSSKKDDSKT